VFGAVKNVDFPTEKNFCFVHFENQEGVNKAMATEDELLWDGYPVWYEPKRPPAPRGVVRGGGTGAGRGKGGKASSTPNENKHDSSNGKQQPQKQQTGGNKTSQNSNQEPSDDQGAWKKVEHRSTRRKQATENKNGQKKS